MTQKGLENWGWQIKSGFAHSAPAFAEYPAPQKVTWPDPPRCAANLHGAEAKSYGGKGADQHVVHTVPDKKNEKIGIYRGFQKSGCPKTDGL